MNKTVHHMNSLHHKKLDPSCHYADLSILIYPNVRKLYRDITSELIQLNVSCDCLVNKYVTGSMSELIIC